MPFTRLVVVFETCAQPLLKWAGCAVRREPGTTIGNLMPKARSQKVRNLMFLQRRRTFMFPRPDSRPLAPILLPRNVSILATKVALHTAVHDSAFIACSRAVGDAGASFGFGPDSVAMKSVRYALGEGWEALWMSFRALDPEWERNLVYWREFTMRVARPAFQDAFWDKLPNRHIPRKIAEKSLKRHSTHCSKRGGRSLSPFFASNPIACMQPTALHGDQAFQPPGMWHTWLHSKPLKPDRLIGQLHEGWRSRGL